jgi:hypothetical protein
MRDRLFIAAYRASGRIHPLLSSPLSSETSRAIAGYGSDDGAANNGFDRRSLHQWEGRLLYMAGYPAPPDFRAPGGWRLSAGGVPIPLSPVGAALDVAIDEVLETMSDERRAEPRFYPDNYQAWTAFFRRRYERELAAYDGPPLLPRTTTPPTAAAGGARRVAPSRPCSHTSRVATRPSLGCRRHSHRLCRAAAGARGCHGGWHPAPPGRRRGWHHGRRHRRRGR